MPQQDRIRNVEAPRDSSLIGNSATTKTIVVELWASMEGRTSSGTAIVFHN